MFPYLYSLVKAIEPLIPVILLVVAWTFTICLGWTVVTTLRDTWRVARRMHRIPCANCQFFTNDHRLKCTLHPKIANTEVAIGCTDYDPKSSPYGQLDSFEDVG